MEGGTCKVLPLRKGGGGGQTKFYLAILKGGHTKFWGSY